MDSLALSQPDTNFAKGLIDATQEGRRTVCGVRPRRGAAWGLLRGASRRAAPARSPVRDVIPDPAHLARKGSRDLLPVLRGRLRSLRADPGYGDRSREP